jgi:chemotaxis family two-component system response regulator Rcp1
MQHSLMGGTVLTVIALQVQTGKESVLLRILKYLKYTANHLRVRQQIDHSIENQRRKNKTVGSLPSRRDLNILLVDDNRGDEVLVKATLKETNLGTRLETVHNGQEAMSCLRKKGKYGGSPRPDIILLDLYMNGQNGYDFLRQIRDEGEFGMIPILMFTSSDSKIQKDACSRFNVSTYIVKSWDLEIYMSVIKAAESYWITLLPSSVEGPSAPMKKAG